MNNFEQHLANIVLGEMRKGPEDTPTKYTQTLGTGKKKALSHKDLMARTTATGILHKKDREGVEHASGRPPTAQIRRDRFAGELKSHRATIKGTKANPVKTSHGEEGMTVPAAVTTAKKSIKTLRRKTGQDRIPEFGTVSQTFRDIPRGRTAGQSGDRTKERAFRGQLGAESKPARGAGEGEVKTRKANESFDHYLTTFLVETMGVMPTPEDKKKGEAAKKSKQDLNKPKPTSKPSNPKQEMMDRVKKRRIGEGWKKTTPEESWENAPKTTPEYGDSRSGTSVGDRIIKKAQWEKNQAALKKKQKKHEAEGKPGKAGFSGGTD